MPQDLVLEKEEKVLGVLNKGGFSNSLLEGTLGSEYVVLSDRRVYYSGKFFNNGQKISGECVIPLEKISSIGAQKKSKPWLLIPAPILMVLGTGVSVDGDGPAIGVPFIVLGLLLVFWFFSSKTNFLGVTAGSTTIAISFKFFGEKEILQFRKELGKAMTQVNAG